jgi:hypothetical protein
MEASQFWAAVAAASASGGALTVLITGLTKFFSGQAGREKLRNHDMKSQRDRALTLLEWERTARRVISEKAAKWRRIGIEHGVTEEELGPWPGFDPYPEEKEGK